MKQDRYYFAVDLGATSGRTILGSLVPSPKGEGYVLEQEELTRFPNNLIETGGHFYWDIYALYFDPRSEGGGAAWHHADLDRHRHVGRGLRVRRR